VCWREGPFTSPPKPLPLPVCLDVWKWEEMGRNQNKNTPLEYMVNTLKMDLMEIMELTSNKLKVLCEVDWPTLV
jgi:hypothetical protein